MAHIRLIIMLAMAAWSSAAQAQTDPSTRELRSIMDERDLRYTQRFNDQEKAVGQPAPVSPSYWHGYGYGPIVPGGLGLIVLILVLLLVLGRI